MKTSAMARQGGAAGTFAANQEAVSIGPLGAAGELTTVPWMNGLVVFVQDSWGGRHPGGRDRRIARILQRHHLGTLQFDLLTESEARDERNRSDIALQARRVTQTLAWVDRCPGLAGLQCGLLGAGTGTAAALVVAASQPRRVAAIASQGGRPELAADRLADVQAPVLLMVGSDDERGLAANRAALRVLPSEKRLEVIPGAGRRFGTPGALESLAELAAWWMEWHLAHRFLS